ncbi:hypothetical protein EDD17DRAFT_1754520 [Pisolithus thermaeus]|nr:hypothetical protein EDD17DRAFT_1754520 [Pisolithus thermaeus]
MSSSDFNAELTLGPALIGTTLASYLFGCSVIQACGYYRRFPLDSRVLKTLQVATVMMLTLAHIVCVVYWTWIITVSAYGKPNEVTIFTPSRGANLVITPFICFLVQLFFAFRLFRFSGSWLLAIICVILSGISFIGTLVDATRALNRQSMAGNMNAQYWLTILALVSGATCDLIIAAGLVFHLRKQRALTKLSRTINLVDKLTIWSIGGPSPFLGLLLDLPLRAARNWACDEYKRRPCHRVLFLATDHMYVYSRTWYTRLWRAAYPFPPSPSLQSLVVWSALYIVLADVYTNTFLAALNGRASHVEHHVTQGPVLSTFVAQAVMPNGSCDVSYCCLSDKCVATPVIDFGSEVVSSAPSVPSSGRHKPSDLSLA